MQIKVESLLRVCVCVFVSLCYAYLCMCALGSTGQAECTPPCAYTKRKEGLEWSSRQPSESLPNCFSHKDTLRIFFYCFASHH